MINFLFVVINSMLFGLDAVSFNTESAVEFNLLIITMVHGLYMIAPNLKSIGKGDLLLLIISGFGQELGWFTHP